MINQGIVTDSDTEKELKKWQQARATAVDEDKLKQQYKNRLNNAQGQHFEREILAGCRMYESHGIATIDKTPEPFRVTSKNHRTGEFTGRFSTHAQPDFQGTLYGGRSIMFEAKRTSKDRITRNVLTDTPTLAKASPRPTEVVVLPSPAGVGLIAVTRTSFPSGLSLIFSQRSSVSLALYFP